MIWITFSATLSLVYAKSRQSPTLYTLKLSEMESLSKVDTVMSDSEPSQHQCQSPHQSPVVTPGPMSFDRLNPVWRFLDHC